MGDEGPEPLYFENCKHAGPDTLIVQRNRGIRWVTCTKCGADFFRKEFYDDLRRRLDVAARDSCGCLGGELFDFLDDEDDTDG
jgi:hypothetical protein